MLFDLEYDRYSIGNKSIELIRSSRHVAKWGFGEVGPGEAVLGPSHLESGPSKTDPGPP